MGKPLTQIKIKGYKSIRDMSLDLGSLNILIGANGAGKSNFISVFTLVRYIVEKRLQLFVSEAGGANNLLYFGRKISAEIELDFVFEKNGYNCHLIPSTEDELLFGDETCLFYNPKYLKPYAQSLGSGHKETALHQKSGESPQSKNIADYILEAMKSWWVYHFHDTSKDAKMKQPGDLHENRFLKPDAGNLAAYLYFLQQTKPYYYGRIVETIQLVAPFFDDFDLHPHDSNTAIRLRWKEKESLDSFPVAHLSDGTLRFICLATLLLQPEPPTTLVIDEPELGLHPYAITLLASLLRQASHHTQIIVSTQSVSLVNQFKPENIIVVNRQDKQSTFSRCNESELEHWLEDYSMGELWERNIIGGRPA